MLPFSSSKSFFETMSTSVALRPDSGVVPPQLVHDVAQFSNDFDARKTSACNHERQQLAAQMDVGFDLRFIQRVNQVVTQIHRICEYAERFER